MQARRGIVLYLQIAAAIVSLLLGLTQITKESTPIVREAVERQRAEHDAKEARKKADVIAQMGIAWQYRYNDGTWRYYSDHECRYWCRVNIQGVYEYSENPQVAMNQKTVR